jgi:4-diphosphocytidyl-2-C-methyl-D-erythritol kinase
MSLTLHAPAKVNLTLEVLGKRDDGFHAIRSVMQWITLADTLTLEHATDLSLTCSDPGLDGPENLVWKAAGLLRREAGTTQGARLTLDKNIPVAAGLGGGSSDAATTLIGLNQLWRLGIPHPRLMELGAELGSDVPFFMGESAAMLVEGRGEVLSPLPPLPQKWLVLVKPGVGISAGAVYRAFPRERWSDGSRTASWLESARNGSTLPRPFNDLEAPALTVEPGAAAARDALIAAGAPWALMSGSGSTYFSLFESEALARPVFQRLKAQGATVFLAGFVTL